MGTTLTGQGTLTVGTPTIIEGPSPSTAFAVVFEDDGETGYLYGLDTSRQDNPILDALHIYNTSNVTDGNKPSTVELLWSSDGLKAALLINRFPHAVFDFNACRGYCRTGFPPPNSEWTQHSHDWDDSAIDLFRPGAG